MGTRQFLGLDGRLWSVGPRPYVRKDEVGTHVTLEFATDREIRVVSVRKSEWEISDPDLMALLVRSVASGASRSVHPPGAAASR